MQNNQDNAQVILALDIGGTFIKSALFQDGKLLQVLPQIPSHSGGNAEEIAVALRTAVSAAGRIDRIGVAIPGPFDYRNGISLMEHKFGAIKERSLLEFLPDIPVRFLHDANAFLLGEWGGQSRIGGITLGTGLGAAVIVDGKLLTNKLGSPADEVSLWSKTFRGTTVEKALQLSRYNKDLAEAARSGDSAAKQAWQNFGEVLAEILTPWCERFQLEEIALGGQISKDFELFKDPLKGLPVRQSAQGEQAALTGAAKQFA